ncbi:MAG: metallophosphoesterase [Chloroflexi bacterium]|nr:metallophosphoesterase [Chloroflexota bacterium]
MADSHSPGEIEESQPLSRRQFLKLGCGALLGGAAVCALGPLYATQVEPGWIQVTRLDIPLPGLPEPLDGFAIAQLSDLHLGPYVSVEDVRRSVEIANDLGADLIVLTGDFVYGSAGYSVACARELASLQARYGVYAVLGNHDNWTDADQVAGNLAGAGIVVLRNERRPLDVNGTRLWLVGIEDTGYVGFFGDFGDFRAMWQEAGDALATLLEGIPADEPRLLLVHNPDFTEMLPEGRIDLVLSGHTHGGQVRLPFVGAPVVPSCFGQKYASGLVQGPGRLVYVNRGIGTIGLPVRFNCRPEVTLLQLRMR